MNEPDTNYRLMGRRDSRSAAGGHWTAGTDGSCSRRRRGPPGRGSSSAVPGAVKTRCPATQSGSACLPERDETCRTLLLLLPASGIHDDGTD